MLQPALEGQAVLESQSDREHAEVARPLPLDPARLAAVQAARDEWIRLLIDPGRSNNLLFFRHLRAGTLNLTKVPTTIEALLGGQRVVLAQLVPEPELDSHRLTYWEAEEARERVREEAERDVRHRLREIHRRAISNLEEKGLETLFLAVGMATWPAPDGGRAYEAPALLVPMTITQRGRAREVAYLQKAGEVQANLVLLHVLEKDYRVRLTAEELLDGIVSEGDGEDERIDPEMAFRRLRDAAAEIGGFEVKETAVLGNFSFQKMAMVRDLREHLEQLVRNDLIAAIAGYGEARAAIANALEDVEPRELDHVPPGDEFLVLDADSSQQRVVLQTVRGQQGVIQGPPGTGKSQTIANLLAELAARGKRVLFVAEKRAALEVVMKRLRECGLEHITLDLHGADVSRKQVMQRIAHTLEAIRESVAVDTTTLHSRFDEVRKRLNDQARRMHTPRPPAGLSVYELQGRILRIPPRARAGTRWRGSALDALTPAVGDEIRALLVELEAFASLFLRTDPSPWTGAKLHRGEVVEEAVDRVAHLASLLWPRFDAALDAIASCTGLSVPKTVDESRAFAAFLTSVSETLRHYPESVYAEDLDDLLQALTPATKGLLASAWAYATDRRYRIARSKLRRIRKDGPAPVQTLFRELQRARAELRRWRSLSREASSPCRPEGHEELKGALDALLGDLDALTQVIVQKDLRREPLADAKAHLNELAADTMTPYRLPRLYQIEERLAALGAGPVVEELRTRAREESLEPRAWPLMFEHAWYASTLDRARAAEPELGGFNGRVHDRHVENFLRLDEERLRLAVLRVRRAHGERAIAAMNEHPDHAALVRREASKKTRHMPLRRLLAEAPDVLTRIAPCWLASPLSVSQLLDGRRKYFDVVIFDEASQVPPEDAVPALMRGNQAVVAGDRHQLPPTMFFVAGTGEEEGEEEAPDAVAGFESVLDILAAFLPNWLLEWHYRSEDERLIAFSNHHIYNGRLVTMPSAASGRCIEHVLVAQQPGLAGQEDSSSAEVKEVVRLVIQHAETRPHETLGVIAMGIRHANRIQAALDEALLLRPDLDDFFSLEREERFFVKNLERVQGDERDAIILSIGYGKSPSGDLPHRFGPLLTDDGYRRLNVAITRARKQMMIVSSFGHHDVDLARARSRGVLLLKHYLEYAARGGAGLGDGSPTEIPLNPFEADVCDALMARGMRLVPQWGASRYRIDLVAQHPQRPGRFVLAIECDGAAYHSLPTARDRDRLRQKHLEKLGWRFHRIWSADWFARRDEEIERALQAYQEAVRRADILDACGYGVGPIPEQDPPPAPSAAFRERAPMPRIRKQATIADYPWIELETLAQWVESDGRLRTEDEMIREMKDALGFQRLGPKIESRLREAIQRYRGRRRRHS